jgi:hypothetical protein
MAYDHLDRQTLKSYSWNRANQTRMKNRRRDIVGLCLNDGYTTKETVEYLRKVFGPTPDNPKGDFPISERTVRRDRAAIRAGRREINLCGECGRPMAKLIKRALRGGV